jgi:hypothetical protein
MIEFLLFFDEGIQGIRGIKEEGIKGMEIKSLAH